MRHEIFTMKGKLKSYKSEFKSRLDDSMVECEKTKKDLDVFKNKSKTAEEQIAELMG